MDMPWWLKYPVTQQFGGGALGFTEAGTDYGTPMGTALTAPFGGKVLAAGYHPWGGEVDISTALPSGQKVTESFLHLDQIFAKPGAMVPAGAVIGLSGGQLTGGTHPTDPKYSQGPHTEIDFWTGTPFASTSVNPQPILSGYAGAGAPSGDTDPYQWFDPRHAIWEAEHAPQAIAGDVGAVGAGIASAGGAIGGAITGIPTSIGHGIADAVGAGVTDVGIWFQRQSVALFVALVVLLVLFL